MFLNSSGTYLSNYMGLLPKGHYISAKPNVLTDNSKVTY
jgi:hypothetical protein